MTSFRTSLLHAHGTRALEAHGPRPVGLVVAIVAIVLSMGQVSLRLPPAAGPPRPAAAAGVQRARVSPPFPAPAPPPHSERITAEAQRTQRVSSPPRPDPHLPLRLCGQSALRPLLNAIRAVESGDDDGAIGDGGRSHGPYQIGLAYWIDGGGEPAAWPAATHDRAASERVMLAYWRRYCPAALAAGDWETLARTHNGGPRGAAKPATEAYWNRVRTRMDAEAHRPQRPPPTCVEAGIAPRVRDGEQ